MCGEIIKKCRHCRQPIEDDAKVCHNCGRHQKRLYNILRQSGIGTSIVLVLIAIFQLIYAYQERAYAFKAVERAEEAEENIKTLHEAFKEHELYVVKMLWLQATIRFVRQTDQEKKVLNNLEDTFYALLEALIPDKNEREKWFKQELEGTSLK